MANSIIINKLPISALVITYNEEKRIRPLFENLKDFAEEIIIVDQSSSDNTREIAKEYTDSIYVTTPKGYCEPDQHYAKEKATKEWILFIDADEVLSDELKKEIYEKFEDKSIENFDGYYIARRSSFLKKWIFHSGWYPDYVLRLAKKKCVETTKNKIHEKIKIHGKVGFLKNDILHSTYDSISQFVDRMNRYTSISAKNMFDDGKFPSIFDLTMRPVYTFFKMFFFQKGFMDSFYGFILAMLYSYYTFLKYLKLWEIYERNKNKK